MWRWTLALLAGCGAPHMHAESGYVVVANSRPCVNHGFVEDEQLSLDEAIVEMVEWGPLGPRERDFVLQAYDRSRLIFVECERQQQPHGPGPHYIAHRRVIVPCTEQALDALHVRDQIARSKPQL
jgi:hypothetical protein